MNNDKPLINIDLQPFLIDFLHHEFAESEDGIVIDTDNDIGKFINSMITVSAFPPAPPKTDSSIVMYLPMRSWNHHVLSGNFITVVPWKRRMIEEYVQAQFNLRLRDFFLTGYEKGFPQKQLIDAFLSFYSIKNNTINFDMVKKKDYRNRKHIIEEVKRAVQLNLQW